MTRILLTGGSGMVGRNILRHARAAGLRIESPSRAELDLADSSEVSNYLEHARPSLIIHAAGRVGGIQANVDRPYEFLLDNLRIGANLIAGANNAGIERLINLSSSCVYPRDVTRGLTEDLILTAPLEPTNEGYALAKIATMKLCESLSRSSSDRAYKTIIPCNLYGSFDHFEASTAHLLPAIIRKIHLAKVAGDATVEVWGDGTARREFMFAGDLADAVLRAAINFESLPSLMNIGVGFDHSILDYYETVAQVIGWRGRFVHDLSRPVGMRRKLLDVSRQVDWGWRPRTSLPEGIRIAYTHFLETCQ